MINEYLQIRVSGKHSKKGGNFYLIPIRDDMNIEYLSRIMERFEPYSSVSISHVVDWICPSCKETCKTKDKVIVCTFCRKSTRPSEGSPGDFNDIFASELKKQNKCIKCGDRLNECRCAFNEKVRSFQVME